MRRLGGGMVSILSSSGGEERGFITIPLFRQPRVKPQDGLAFPNKSAGGTPSLANGIFSIGSPIEVWHVLSGVPQANFLRSWGRSLSISTKYNKNE
jgi:hypothetical protein